MGRVVEGRRRRCAARFHRRRKERDRSDPLGPRERSEGRQALSARRARRVFVARVPANSFLQLLERRSPRASGVTPHRGLDAPPSIVARPRRVRVLGLIGNAGEVVSLREAVGTDRAPGPHEGRLAALKGESRAAWSSLGILPRLESLRVCREAGRSGRSAAEAAPIRSGKKTSRGHATRGQGRDIKPRGVCESSARSRGARQELADDEPEPSRGCRQQTGDCAMKFGERFRKRAAGCALRHMAWGRVGKTLVQRSCNAAGCVGGAQPAARLGRSPLRAASAACCALRQDLLVVLVERISREYHARKGARARTCVSVKRKKKTTDLRTDRFARICGASTWRTA